MHKLRPALAVLLGCTALAGTPPPAQASPDGAAPGDAVLSLLHERGLVAGQAIGAEASALARHVRDTASGLVISAMNFLGVRYRRGGSSPEQGFDCSGFTRHIFEKTVGLVLPRRADEQARDESLQPVAREQLEPGDLVFFDTMRRAFSHVGIYIGDGKFIHAPRSGGAVRVEDMREAYWARRFNGARRAGLDTATATAAPEAPVRSH